MGIWDISPGYLNGQLLRNEWQALERLASKSGDAKADPELERWQQCQGALAWREALVQAELRLRGESCSTQVQGLPIKKATGMVQWPQTMVSPAAQYALLRDLEPGRIALPRSSQELWAQHKYSVMARDPASYRTLGKRVALGQEADFAPLAEELVHILREAPQPGRLFNALEHMWGYVGRQATEAERQAARCSPAALLNATVKLALRTHEPYLLASTALSDLAVFVDEGEGLD